MGIFNEQLRFFTPNGELVSTPEKAEAISIQTTQQAHAERQRAETAYQRADRLLQKL